MSGIWIKICGITRAEDAEAAAKFGADAVGVVLFPESPRAIDVKQCATLLSGLPSSIVKVALFVDPTIEMVQSAVATGLIDLLQFHGNETAEFCQQFGLPYMKAIRVQNYQQASTEMNEYASAEYILLDRYQNNVPGGTGKTFDWDVAKDLVVESCQKVVLAGGLNPDNVVQAKAKVRPFGMDVSSGVEQSPGVKELDKVRSFIEAGKRG